jgi:hypothetical protein
MRDLSPPPDDPRSSVLSRLREFEDAGIVDDVSVRVWGKSVIASSDSNEESGHPIQQRIADFRTWADRSGHSLEPAFRWSEQSTMFSEERTKVVQLPLQCLAIYEDDCLVGVFPCSTDARTETVTDCLQRLEAGDIVGDSNAE